MQYPPLKRESEKALKNHDNTRLIFFEAMKATREDPMDAVKKQHAKLTFEEYTTAYDGFMASLVAYDGAWRCVGWMKSTMADALEDCQPSAEKK